MSGEGSRSSARRAQLVGSLLVALAIAAITVAVVSARLSDVHDRLPELEEQREEEAERLEEQREEEAERLEEQRDGD